MAKRSYDGPAVDGRVQYLSEASYWNNDEDEDDVDELDAAASQTVYATPPEPAGEERTENVPVPGEISDDVEGQSTLDDWGLGSDG